MLIVYFLSMPHSYHINNQLGIYNVINDSIVTYTYAVSTPTL